jgi:hypothetical protein
VTRKGGTYLRPSSARSGAVPHQLEAPAKYADPNKINLIGIS